METNEKKKRVERKKIIQTNNKKKSVYRLNQKCPFTGHKKCLCHKQRYNLVERAGQTERERNSERQRMRNDKKDRFQNGVKI